MWKNGSVKPAKNSVELAAPWIRELEVESAAAMSVRDWWRSAQRVYPANTQRAWRSDWQVYEGFCAERAVSTVLAAPATFVDACGERSKKPATIRRYLTTVVLVHRVAKLDNPCIEEQVRHALKGLTNEVASAQRQARALGWAEDPAILLIALERACRRRASGRCSAWPTTRWPAGASSSRSIAATSGSSRTAPVGR